MGNLCTSTKSANDGRRQPDSRRKGSGSTTGFSPTEDLGYVPEQDDGGGGAAAALGGAALATTNGGSVGDGQEVSASQVEVSTT
ncbi:unnamed protein product, partial [Ectocarpus sp. 12 AP-2014]